MVITPQEAEKMTQYEDDFIQNLEEQIDDALKSKFMGSGSVSVNLPSLGGIRRNAVDRVMQDYRRAGWNVTYKSDQREGNWLELSDRENDTRLVQAYYDK
ncbi:hypothetical protein ACFL1H_07175 [Nanoarchaeota archaeon]